METALPQRPVEKYVIFNFFWGKHTFLNCASESLNDERVKLDLSLTKRFNFKFKLRDSVWIIHHVLNRLTRKSTWILIKNVTFSIYKNLTLLCWNIKNYKKLNFLDVCWKFISAYSAFYFIWAAVGHKQEHSWRA